MDKKFTHLCLNENNKIECKINDDTYSRPYHYKDYHPKRGDVQEVYANPRISYTPQEIKRKAEDLNKPWNYFDKPNHDLYSKKLSLPNEDRYENNKIDRGLDYGDYKKKYLERESVKRKPVESRLDFVSKTPQTVKRDKRDHRDERWRDMVPDSPSERKRDKDQRSHYNDDKRHNGREIKAVSVTPVKSVYSRYPLTYKNEISDSSKQAYKRYNYEPRRSDQSEFTVEDAVSQAPNPSAHPKPSKDFKSSKTPPEYDLPDPVYDRVTGGYLAPQIEENLGKKTLILDLDETLIHSWFKPINSPDLCLDVKIKNKFTKIYVLTRPWVYNFLDEVQKLFEVVIFTASVSTYAIPIINKLDRTDYQYQMLFRQH